MTNRILIIDPSPIVREILSIELGKIDFIDAVDVAPDLHVGRDHIVESKPNLVIMDLDLSGVDGITFLRTLTQCYSIPVIVFSSQVEEEHSRVWAICQAGAEVMYKPSSSYGIMKVVFALVEKIRMNICPHARRSLRRNVIVAIGASTGGAQAIQKVLSRFPADAPPTVIVQHMPAPFTTSFAQRLNKCCNLTVREARNHDVVESGVALLAPGNYHLCLTPSRRSYIVEVTNGAKVYYQRPSVDVLFNSVAECASSDSIGVLLTGMGKDGAQGMLRMREAGAYTIAQDDPSSVVYGMPGEAAKIGASCSILPLKRIADAIFAEVKKRKATELAR
ncbi:MAG: response regulator [Kiritimatiellae bacterium]|nr:response regulator [Kiritimatiellia bacterium]